jgi:Prohead core protein serine protease
MLLLEFNKADIETKGGKTFVTGPFMTADVVNRNNRLYPSAILETAVDAIRPQIKDGTFYGQLGHPASMNGDARHISHRITNLDRRGNVWIGKARLINEGAGRIAQSIIDTGGKLGISLRGLGDVKEDKTKGHQVVCEGFRLLSFDLVTDPSMPGAFLTALRESVDELPEDQARIVYNLFGRHDFKHCEPTIPVDKTYLQNLEALATDVAERLRALQAKDEVQMTKDGLTQVNKRRYADALRKENLDHISVARQRRDARQKLIEQANMRRASELLGRVVKRKGQ